MRREGSMEDKRTPINKGNFSLDTPEREAIFELYRSEGWETDYRAYREAWTEYPRKQIIADYPLLVDTELSSLCNLKCPMCYTITEEFKKKIKATLMDYSLFQKIIDEITGKVPALRLSLRGEPTLHPHFIDCIRYAKENGIGEVSFLTNGSTLTSDVFTEIMQAGADWITISLDGMDETYEDIRKPLKFRETLSKIVSARNIKEKAGSHKPVIKVQSIWPAIRENTEHYYNTLMPYVDLIAFNPLIDYLGNDQDIIYMDSFICPQHYQRLVIASDGQALMCANDPVNMEPVGNAATESIYSIWHGPRLTEIREMHKNNLFQSIPVCRKCYLPRQTEENERGTVNGRTFTVKNYINRDQEIGK